MQIYLVRTAQAKSNLDNPAPEFAEYKDIDLSLTELGQKQADLTGKRLASVEFDAILTSPLLHHLATANGIIRYQKSCKTTEPMSDLYAKDISVEITDESMAERGKNIERYLTNNFEKNAKVLLIASGDFMSRFLIPSLLRLPARVIKSGIEFHCDSCAVSRIDLNKDGRRADCVLLNNTSHLDVDEEQIVKIKNS